MKLAVPLPVLMFCALSACSHPAHEGALGLLDGSCDSILDPLFSSQWHLLNTGQSGGTAGEDTNVVPVGRRACAEGASVLRSSMTAFRSGTRILQRISTGLEATIF